MMKMKTYTADELRAIIDAHGAYLRGEAGGKRADLRGCDLSYSDLRDSNLRDSDLRCSNLGGCDLRDSNLRDSNLRDSDLRGSDLGGCDLRGSNLRYSDLSYSDLSGSDLRGSNLGGCDLGGCDLRDSDLRGSDLRDSDLRDSNLHGASLPHFLIVPQQGSFIGWKKTRGGVIKVEIPADARRCNSLVGRKCRAEFVRTLEVNGSTKPVTAYGLHDPSTAYRVGEITRADSYDDDIRVECTHGIHFFITREEAEDY